MFRKDLPDGFAVVPYDSTTVNCLYLPQLNTAGEDYAGPYFALLMPDGRAAAGESGRPHRYDGLEACVRDAEVLRRRRKVPDRRRWRDSMRPWRHRYGTADGEGPLQVCPACGASLADDDGCRLLLQVGGQEIRLPTRLDDDGEAVDVDGTIASGYHSDTLCGKCGLSLADREVL